MTSFTVGDWVTIVSQDSPAWRNPEGHLVQPLADEHGRPTQDLPPLLGALGEIKQIIQFTGEEEPTYAIRCHLDLMAGCINDWWFCRTGDLAPAEPSEDEQFAVLLSHLTDFADVP